MDNIGECQQLWRSQYISQVEDLSEIEEHLLILKRYVYLILNRLTPTNFTNLVQEFLSLNVNSIECIELIVSLIHEKAIKEPLYSKCYAQLSRILAEQLPIVYIQDDETKPANVTDFRTLLLERCQKEFETGLKKFVAEDQNEGIEEKLWKKIIYYRHYEKRQRDYGNIIFIGNIWKAKVIGDDVINDCIHTLLLTNKDELAEDNLECLIKLLSEIGKELDNNEIRVPLDRYFQMISDIQSKYDISTRINFALQDLQELRSNNWVPRFPKEYPRPLHELRML